jgi:predicted  nucleic acid-binding Zn-ribbon protein
MPSNSFKSNTWNYNHINYILTNKTYIGNDIYPTIIPKELYDKVNDKSYIKLNTIKKLQLDISSYDSRLQDIMNKYSNYIDTEVQTDDIYKDIEQITKLYDNILTIKEQINELYKYINDTENIINNKLNKIKDNIDNINK